MKMATLDVPDEVEGDTLAALLSAEGVGEYQTGDDGGLEAALEAVTDSPIPVADDSEAPVFACDAPTGITMYTVLHGTCNGSGDHPGALFEAVIIGKVAQQVRSGERDYIIAVPPAVFPRQVAARSISAPDAVKGVPRIEVDAILTSCDDVFNGVTDADEEAATIGVAMVRVRESFAKRLATHDNPPQGTLVLGTLHGPWREYPTATALVAAAGQQRGYATGAATASPPPTEATRRTQAHSSAAAGEPDAMAVMAASMATLSKAVTSLTQDMIALKSGVVTPPAIPTSKAPAMSKPQLSRASLLATGLPMIDAELAAEAVKAGIPMEELTRVASLLSKKAPRLTAEPRRPPAEPPGPAQQGTLDESDGEAPAPPPASATDQAIQQLANVSKQLAVLVTAKEAVPRSTLESALDGDTRGSSEASATSGRRNAVAYQLLCDTLESNPTALSGPMLKAMAKSSVGTLGEVAEGQTANPLFWLEHRSRITGEYKSNVNWAWLAGHVARCLIEKKPEEALTRALLMMAAADTIALDEGSWLAAYELQFTPEPPYQSFENHRPATSKTLHSGLIDPRWNEVIINRLKDVDETVKRRQQLKEPGQARRPPAKGPKGGRGDGTGAPPGDKDKGAKGGGK